MKIIVSRGICCLMAIMIVTGFMVPEAFADADKDAKKESRRMQVQLSAAQKEKAVLATQVDDLKKQLGEIGTKSAALEKKTGGQRKQLAEMTEQYQEADKNLQQMMQMYVDASASLQQLQTEKEQEQKRLSGEIRVCENKNAELYRINMALMDKYQSKGMLSVLLQAEPFTQLERVKIQNLMQEYGDKAEAAKIASSKVHVSLPGGNVPANAAPGDAPAAATGDSSKAVPGDTNGAASNTGATGAIPTADPVQVSNIAPANDVTGASGTAPVTDTSGKAQAELGGK